MRILLLVILIVDFGAVSYYNPASYFMLILMKENAKNQMHN